MHYPFSKKEIPLRNWWLKLTEWRAWEGRGNYLLTWLEGFFNLRNIAVEGGVLLLVWDKIKNRGISWADVLIYLALFLGFFAFKIVKAIVGRFDIKRGKNSLYQAEVHWRSKNQEISPVGIENIRTHVSQSKALGCPHYFTDMKTGKVSDFGVEPNYDKKK